MDKKLLQKESLLSIAMAAMAIGGSLMQTNVYLGSVLVFVALLLPFYRGYLKKK